MRNKPSVVTTFIFAVITGSTIFIALALPFAMIYTRNQQYGEAIKKHELLLKLVAQAVGQNLKVYDYSEVRNQLKRMRSEDTDYAVVSSNDELLFSNQELIDKYGISANDIRRLYKPSDNTPIEYLSSDKRNNILMIDEIQHGLNKYERDAKSSLIISFTDKSRLLRTKMGTWLIPIIIVVGLTLLMASILIMVILKIVIRPIKNITKDLADKSLAIEKASGNVLDSAPPMADEGKIRELLNLERSIQKLFLAYGRLKQDAVSNASLISIGQSTAMVAHDVRKPLASMKALLTSLPMIKDNPEELKKMTAAVDGNITRTNAMLNEILDFSRDSSALDLKDHDPQSIITSALGDALRNHPGSSISIEYDLHHRHALHVDGTRVIRVLTNIIDNALDAMTIDSGKAFGNIRISSYEKEKEGAPVLGVTITDDGPGMPEDVLPKIFDPFFTKGKKGGTGLGLAICHRIISMHGGHIEARNSLNIGTGATVIVELPASDKRVGMNESELIRSSNELKVFRDEEAARIDEGDTANTAEFMRINKERGRQSYLLVVDDEPLFRETVRGLLHTMPQVRDHVKIIEADSGEMGLKIFEGREFDYVIADIDLGRGHVNGYSFSQEVLKKYPNTHVLIHSNKRKDELDKNIREIASGKALAMPANGVIASRAKQSPEGKFMGFLPKPMRANELLQFLACKTFEVPNPPISPLGKEGKKILLLNDDEDFNLGLKLTLKSDNIQVLDSTNVSDALDQLTKTANIDAVFSDINLGEGFPNGYDFLSQVRQKGTSIPFYFMSGYNKEEVWERAAHLGADGYLQLPFEIEELRSLLGM